MVRVCDCLLWRDFISHDSLCFDLIIFKCVQLGRNLYSESGMIIPSLGLLSNDLYKRGSRQILSSGWENTLYSRGNLSLPQVLSCSRKDCFHKKCRYTFLNSRMSHKVSLTEDEIKNKVTCRFESGKMHYIKSKTILLLWYQNWFC